MRKPIHRSAPGRLALLALVAMAMPLQAQACDAPWTGVWDVTAAFAGGASAASMTLKMKDGGIEGAAGPLDEAQFFPLAIKGTVEGTGAELNLTAIDKPAGTLTLTCEAGKLSGRGTLFATPVTLAGVRPGAPSRAPRTFDFAPTRYSIQYSSTIEPVLGSIGVAAPLNQAIFAGDLGFHGGNLDYPRLTAGATVYLPVWRGGAYLYLGDGHALQGDGEISGQGLETSLDVVFKIELIKGKTLGQVWMEDASDVMVSGIENGLDASLRMATTGLARWLKDRYGLNDSEIAAF